MTELLANGELIVEVKNRVAHLTLNRPQALNALSYEMIKGMAALFTQWSKDPRILAVVMKGAGEKAFCAGGDIRALRDSALNNGTLHHDFFIDEYRLDYQLHRYVKPVICLLDGIVMGGGMGISQGSGYRIVGPKTKMAMPETGIGLFPDVGGSYFLSRSNVGLYLGLTGLTFGAADALYANLADRFMTNQAIAALLQGLDGVQWSSRPVDDIAALIERHASDAGPAPLAALAAAIDAHFVPHKSAREIVESLASTFAPEQQPWAQETAALLNRRSPVMLEVTRRQLNRGARQSLAESFRMELGMVYECFEHGDLLEGIRAVILDKDNNPQWKPPTLAEVTDAQVAAFFAERWAGSPHPLANLEAFYG
jgi:enoyl-CoA hydratase/carnithine racemase